eukprot:861478-Pelagomonas_calceolata.AAC.1
MSLLKPPLLGGRSCPALTVCSTWPDCHNSMAAKISAVPFSSMEMVMGSSSCYVQHVELLVQGQAGGATPKGTEYCAYEVIRSSAVCLWPSRAVPCVCSHAQQCCVFLTERSSAVCLKPCTAVLCVSGRAQQCCKFLAERSSAVCFWPSAAVLCVSGRAQQCCVFLAMSSSAVCLWPSAAVPCVCSPA